MCLKSILVWYLFRDHGQIDVLSFEIYFHSKSVAHSRKKQKNIPFFFCEIHLLSENLICSKCEGNRALFSTLKYYFPKIGVLF